MVGVPKCWACGNIDVFSSARRIYCEKCNVNLWWKMREFPIEMKYKPGSRK